MKTLALFILVCLMCTATAQTVKVEANNDKTLNAVLSNVESLSIKEADDFLIRVYLMADPSGSAKTPETDEITHHLLISISQYGEDPPSSLFFVGHFYNPKIIKEGKIGHLAYFLEVKYGPVDQTKIQRIVISKDSVRLE